MPPLATYRYDYLGVQVFDNRQAMGEAAAEAVGRYLRQRLAQHEDVRVAFAAAPSQDDFLAALVAQPLDWTRVVAFQLDEYLGLPDDHPQRFSRYLQAHLFDRVPMGTVHTMQAHVSDGEAEAMRYARLLRAAPLDLACLGIGENGHLAFNDPPVADFADPLPVKRVTLDAACRQQQVHDGCFPAVEDVPPRALTLTIPALMAAARLSVVVPGPRKAQAVYDTLKGPIAPACPASVLRYHRHACLYVDRAAFARVASLNAPTA